MLSRKFFPAFIVAVALLLFSSCKDNPVSEDKPPDYASDGRISITNNSAALNARVRYYSDTDVPLDTTVVPSGRLAKAAGSFKLKLRAEVSPPVSGGTTLQATHVALTGNYAYVSYNVAGATYLGGVDVFNVQNKNAPLLVSQAIFLNSDVSAVTYDNGKLFLAEATSDTSFVYPAVLEEITLQNNLLTLTSRRKGVSSYVATDVKAYGGKLFVSSGSGGPAVGGLTVLDQSTLNEVSSDQFLDARAVNVYGTLITLMQGTPARLRIYDGATNAFVRSVTVGGANIPESKSTANVVLTRAFVATGDQGLKVVSLTNDAIVDSLPAAVVSGLDPSLTVTNAVSVNEDLVFLANGEAGIYVAEADFNLETTPAGSPGLRLLGKMQFGSQQSANFVASKGDVVFIATGLGGLKIVEISN